MEDSTMEKYEELKLAVIYFETEDVIVTSVTETSETGVIILPDL
jgi:hypothetical protein